MECGDGDARKVVTKQTLRSCDCLCWHLLYCFFFYSFITATLRCLKRLLLSKPAFPPDGDVPDFLFILNFGFTLRSEAGCCCVSCPIVRAVSLHGCGSPLAHWSRPPHLIILTCDSPPPPFYSSSTSFPRQFSLV